MGSGFARDTFACKRLSGCLSGLSDNRRIRSGMCNSCRSIFTLTIGRECPKPIENSCSEKGRSPGIHISRRLPIRSPIDTQYHPWNGQCDNKTYRLLPRPSFSNHATTSLPVGYQTLPTPPPSTAIIILFPPLKLRQAHRPHVLIAQNLIPQPPTSA